MSPTLPEPTPPLVMEFLAFCAEHELCDTFWWRCDGEYAPVTFFANCNDLFYWGCADAEKVDEDTFPVLRQAAQDINAIDTTLIGYCDQLFCARLRKMRPQGACYKHLPEKLWPLFDACGPVRELGIGNPVEHPSEVIRSLEEERNG